MDSVSLLSALLTEERRLRTLAEEEVRAYRKTLTTLALRLAPAAFDARRRQDPVSFERFSPRDWEHFFESVTQREERPREGWGGEQRANSQQPSGISLQQATGNEPRATSQPPSASSPEPAATIQQPKVSNQNATGNQRRVASQQPTATRQQPIAESRPLNAESLTDRQQPSASNHPPDADSRKPKADRFSLPPSPPSRYAALFTHWEREGLALQILASTGWSLRYAVDEALASNLGIGTGSGSVKRLFARLEKMGLVTSTVYDLGGVRAAILLLSERGKQVAGSCGFPPVASEWETLLAAHGGERQARHAALCCAFAYQARKRGWRVELCPDVPGNAEPDMALHRGEERIFVEVEAESGEAERRMRKWRNLADLQGYVALCANNTGVRERLSAEARAASKQGVATDLTSLIKGQEGDDSLWVEGWGRKAAVSGQ